MKYFYIQVLKHGTKIKWLGESKYRLIQYYKNGNKKWEAEYKGDKRHGKHIRWYENGNKYWERDYKDDKVHDKYIGWHKSGNKYWEAEYRDGKLHGKDISWYENGNKCWEYYWEGSLVSKQEYLSLSKSNKK